ncbi:MAG: DUF4148 domain-containing protein [Polaromonas sp.]
MQSKLVSASILAIAALSSASSFAEGYIPGLSDQASVTSTKTRAEVRAELLQAQREGYTVNIGNTYQAQDSSTPTHSKTRAEVKAEAAASDTRVSGSTIERAYPVVQ